MVVDIQKYLIHKSKLPKVVVQSYKEVRTDEAKAIRRLVKQQTGKDHTPFRAKKLQPREDGKVGTVTPSQQRPCDKY